MRIRRGRALYPSYVTNPLMWRKRLAICALVSGAIGIVVVVIVVPVQQETLEAWYSVPATVAGPLLLVVALICLVVRGLLPAIQSREGRARTRYVVLMLVIAVLIGVLATLGLIIVEYIAGALAYCIPIGFDGCLP